MVEKPLVMGHEGAGVISKVGEGVTSLKVGDRVAIEPGVPCGQCEECKTGDYNICDGLKYCANPPTDGNMCRFYYHPASCCYK